MKTNWKEVCKFLSGAFFVSSGVSWYLAYNHIATPIFGWTVSPELSAIRGCVHFALFLITLYFGFIRKSRA